MRDGQWPRRALAVALVGAVFVAGTAVGFYRPYPVDEVRDAVSGMFSSDPDPPADAGGLGGSRLAAIEAFLDDRRSALAQQRDLALASDPDELRAALVEAFAIPPECLAGAVPEVVERREVATQDGVPIEYLNLRVCGGAFTLDGLYAATGAPLAFFIVGTCGSPGRAFGLGSEDYMRRGALELARNGFSVFAPHVITEPIADDLPTNAAGVQDECRTPDNNELRRELHRRAEVLGYSLLGIELGQLISAADWFDHEDRAVYGISLGGLLAFHLGALDTSFDEVMVSNWSEDREGKLVGTDYPSPLWRQWAGEHAYVDGYLGVADDRILALLVAPRRLYLEVGDEDPREPFTRENVDEMRALYQARGHDPESVQLFVGSGGHETFVEGILGFTEFGG